MKILIVSQYYYPEQFLINEIAPEFVKRGHKVTVLTGLPNYPDGIVPLDYRRGHKRDEIVNGVHIIRSYEIGRKNGKLNLILNYVSFAVSGSRRSKKVGADFDAIFCYQLSPITMVKPALSYRKKYGTPILLYCLDIWPESAQAHVYNGKGLLYRSIAIYSKKVYQACDKIAVTSQPFIDYMINTNGIPAEHLKFIPQHADGAMLDLDLSSENNGIADFMFAGNLGEGQKIETIIKAVAILKDKPGFQVHIVGDGSMRAKLVQMTKDEKISNKVIFHGQKSRSEMPEWYKKADALLITLRGNNYVGNTMPGKLQTYMTTGKPIFGAINGAAKQTIEEAQCGACAMAEDSKGLAELMVDYIDRPQKYIACGDNAKAYFKQHFIFPVFMDRVEKELMELQANEF